MRTQYIDIDALIVQAEKGGGGEPSPEHIGMLVAMGFSTPQGEESSTRLVTRDCFVGSTH